MQRKIILVFFMLFALLLGACASNNQSNQGPGGNNMNQNQGGQSSNNQSNQGPGGNNMNQNQGGQSSNNQPNQGPGGNNMNQGGQKIELSAPPVFIVSPLDPAHVSQVSKFRSCAGHDFSPGVRGYGPPGSEGARSMKHYLGTDVPLVPANSLPVYAPISGTVEIQEETFPLGKQVYLKSGGWSVRIFHVDPTVENGAQVKAGDQVGTLPPAKAAELLGNRPGPNGEVPTYEFDIAITSDDNNQYLSMFDLMDPAVAQQWSARGFTAENTMISKEERDASPCELGPDGERFLKQEYNPEDWVQASH